MSAVVFRSTPAKVLPHKIADKPRPDRCFYKTFLPATHAFLFYKVDYTAEFDVKFLLPLWI